MTHFLFIPRQRIPNIFSFGGINKCMKNYIATIRIRGRQVRTRVWADDPIHARLLLQYLFGMNSIAAGPVLAEGDCQHLPDAEQLSVQEAKISTIKPIKPIKPVAAKTPEQAQIDSLKARKDQATQALKAAQQRQRVVKAQRTLQRAVRPTLPK